MIIVFSDLDGTLLDHDTYSYGESLEGISLLKERGAPLILVSSKTVPEMKDIHRELKLDTPFIFENGGGTAFPDKKSSNEFRIDLTGKTITELDDSFYLTEKFFGNSIKKITDMSIAEVMKRTSLSEERSRLAQMRKTSIPFITTEPVKIDITSINSMNRELFQSGYRITKGGRFFHFTSIETSKGNAVKRLIEHYTTRDSGILTAAVGDSENDIPMLLEVNFPCIVRKKDNSYINTNIENINIASKPGPAGFTEAVKKIIANLAAKNQD